MCFLLLLGAGDIISLIITYQKQSVKAHSIILYTQYYPLYIILYQILTKINSCFREGKYMNYSEYGLSIAIFLILCFCGNKT